MMIAVAGCVAQAEGAEIAAPRARCRHRGRAADLSPPARDGGARDARARAARGVLDTEFPAEDKFDHLPEASAAPGPRAFLTVQEGCDKFCTFCVVPYTRGAEYSRPAADSAGRGARAWSTRGAREITLLGQNVNAYRGAAPDGGDLGPRPPDPRVWPRSTASTRIRYTTSHPRDMDDELIAAHGEVPKLMPYLHLPVQSGSDRVLAAMNRRHTADDYLRLVERMRARAARHRAVVGFHRRLPRRDARRISRRRSRWSSDDRLRPGLFVQVQPAARHAGGGAWRTRCPTP